MSGECSQVIFILQGNNEIDVQISFTEYQEIQIYFLVSDQINIKCLVTF